MACKKCLVGRKIIGNRGRRSECYLFAVCIAWIAWVERAYLTWLGLFDWASPLHLFIEAADFKTSEKRRTLSVTKSWCQAVAVCNLRYDPDCLKASCSAADCRLELGAGFSGTACVSQNFRRSVVIAVAAVLHVQSFHGMLQVMFFS